MEKLNVFKIGGGIIEDLPELENFLRELSQFSGKKILVHGGGRGADALLEQMGIQPEMVEGRRITNDETLEVVEMYYAGKLNKQMVALLQSFGLDAVGLTGADGNALQSTLRPVKNIDFGWVGDLTPEGVNISFIHGLLQKGNTPVFCAITHDGKGHLLNTNADSIAAQIAIALSKQYEVSLHYCFDQLGVMREVGNPDSLLSRISYEEYAQLKEKEIITGGMIPKLDYAFEVLKTPVKEVILEHPNELNTHRKTVLWLNSVH